MNYADLLQNSLLADQYSGMIQSNTAPNPQQYLWDYIGNALNLPTQNVTPTVPATGGEQIPSTGAYVVPQPVPNTGMDTQSGERDIDLNQYAGPSSDQYDYTDVGPDEEVIEQGGKLIIVPKDRSTGIPRVIEGTGDKIREWFNLPDKDYDKRDTVRPLPPLTREQKVLKEIEIQGKAEDAERGQRDKRKQEEAIYRQEVTEQEMANRYRQAQQYYDLVQKGAWDATMRNIYGDKYSPTKAQNRMAKSALAEAAMYGAVAQQASAGIVPRSRYQGKNIAIG